MLDHKLRPFLLEVNHTPSFTADTPLDHNVKYRVVKDSLELLGLKSGNRRRYYSNYHQELVNRTTKGQKDIKIYREQIRL